MPRKGFVSRRTVPGDAVYDSDLVQKFINSMMWDGKRSTAQRIFYGAMDQIGQKTGCYSIPPVIAKFTVRVYTWRNRVLQRALKRLELLDAKVSRAVLRGQDGGTTILLPDTDLKAAEWIADLAHAWLVASQFCPTSPPTPRTRTHALSEYAPS